MRDKMKWVLRNGSFATEIDWGMMEVCEEREEFWWFVCWDVWMWDLWMRMWVYLWDYLIINDVYKIRRVYDHI